MILFLILLTMRVLFNFLLKLNSHHSYTFTSPLQQTLKQDHHALHNCYSVINMLNFLAFKWILNELLFETEWLEVMLIWWFVSIKFSRSFLKFAFLYLYPNDFHCNFNFTGEAVSFPSTDIIMVALFCFSSVFVRQKGIIFFFWPIF